MGRSAAKLLAPTGAEKRRLLLALVVLPGIAAALRLAGLRRTRALLDRWSPRRDVECSAREATATACLVMAAARRGPVRFACLAESVLLWWLLRRGGADPRLRLGVDTGGDRLRAHAWVELEGRVLNDRDDVGRRYAPFAHDFGASELGGRRARCP